MMSAFSWDKKSAAYGDLIEGSSHWRKQKELNKRKVWSSDCYNGVPVYGRDYSATYFTLTESAKISEIQIKGSPEAAYPKIDGYVIVQLFFVSPEGREDFWKTFRDSSLSIFDTQAPHALYRQKDDDVVIRVNDNDPSLLYFLEQVRAFDPLVDDGLFQAIFNLRNLFNEVVLPKPDKILFEELNQLLAQDKIDEAIQFAVAQQDKNHYALYWEIVKLFEQKCKEPINGITFVHVYELYKRAQTTNPYYQSIKKSIFSLLLQVDTSDINTGERRELLKLKFEALFNLKDADTEEHFQALAGKIALELAGEPAVLEGGMPINADAKTIIRLLDALHAKNLALKAAKQLASAPAFWQEQKQKHVAGLGEKNTSIVRAQSSSF